MDAFTHIENTIAEWRRTGATPRNVRLTFDMPDIEPAARAYKPGDLVRIKDDVEDYGGKVGIVVEDDGSNDWPFKVQIHGVPTPDAFNSEDLDAWAPTQH